MDTYELNRGIDEDNFDRVKASILTALVDEGLIDKEAAIEWCKTHTVILTKRNWFWNILDKVFDPSKQVGEEYRILVVKVVE